jgi:hypothetical protein
MSVGSGLLFAQAIEDNLIPTAVLAWGKSVLWLAHESQKAMNHSYNEQKKNF